MPSPKDFETSVSPTWCPGCGNYGIWEAVKQALADLGLEPHRFFYVWGIGCHGNGADFLSVNGFHALHGRALPVASAARLANHAIKVIVEVGDGDGYGIGGNHLLHTCRRNIDLTLIGHDNQVYGLTTGQTSPTSDRLYASPSTPFGVIERPVNPLAIALVQGATYVARGFAGESEHLTQLIEGAIEHPGFALVDVLQPCVTFNKKNTVKWFRDRVVELDEIGHDPADLRAAIDVSLGRFDVDRALQARKESEPPDEGYLPIGLLYREIRSTYEEEEPALAFGPLVAQPLEGRDLGPLLARYR